MKLKKHQKDMAGSRNSKYPDIELVAQYVSRLFETRSNTNTFLIYHNIAHTNTVVARARQIAAFYQLSETEINIIETAAFFHDCGHLVGPSLDHEKRSVFIMKEFMELHSISEAIVWQIETAIMATKLPTTPQNLREQILCDADLFHLGTLEFFVMDLLMRREYELRNKTTIPNWDETSLVLLQTHKFHTSYCQDLLHEGQAKNVALQIQKIDRNRSENNT